MSIRIQIDRKEVRSDCIIGDLTVQTPFANGKTQVYTCKTLELPWRNNENGVSCIPAGRYAAFVRTDLGATGKRGWRIQLKGTGARHEIQIHTGNYPREIKGCILVGTVKSSSSVLNSVIARDKIKAIVEREKGIPDLTVEIFNTYISDAFENRGRE